MGAPISNQRTSAGRRLECCIQDKAVLAEEVPSLPGSQPQFKSFPGLMNVPLQRLTTEVLRQSHVTGGKTGAPTTERACRSSLCTTSMSRMPPGSRRHPSVRLSSSPIPPTGPGTTVLAPGLLSLLEHSWLDKFWDHRCSNPGVSVIPGYAPADCSFSRLWLTSSCSWHADFECVRMLRISGCWCPDELPSEEQS